MAQKPTPEFHAEAVRIALTSGLSCRQVATDLGLGADSSRGLIAGIERRRRQLGHGVQIPYKPFPDRLGLAGQDIRLTLAGLLLQVAVEHIPTGEPLDRHHEVAAGIADQPLRTALVVSLSGAAIAVTEQVERHEPAEERGSLTCPVRQDLRHQAAVVVEEHRRRHLAEEGEGVDVAVGPGFRRRCRIGRARAGVWRL